MSTNYQIALPLQQPPLEDTTIYEFPSKQKRPPGIVGRLLTETDWSQNFKGDIAEYYAVFRLMLKGIRVYCNSGCDGKTDLLIEYKNNYYPLDVKLACWSYCGGGYYAWDCPKARHVKAPVIALIVVPATGEDSSGWYCRWRNNRKGEAYAPEGLQDLWD